LVDSTSLTVAPRATAVPTSGIWTKTMSPSASCAYSVMPIRAREPSSLTHS
jgi:hypothetical protein